NQQGGVSEGLLAAAAENETLKESLLFVNTSSGRYFQSQYRGRYTLGGPPTTFGASLNRSFLERGIAFNLDVHYVETTGVRRTASVVYMGAPSDNAVAASRVVTLYDDDHLYAPEAGGVTETNTTLAEADAAANQSLYLPDAHSGPLYNVVEVEVIVWRM
ncbi:MAG: DUF7288 family protein, partial [Halobacteriota archaeon]